MATYQPGGQQLRQCPPSRCSWDDFDILAPRPLIEHRRMPSTTIVSSSGPGITHTPKADHYDNNILVSPHFAPTPDITPVDRVYSKYGQAEQAEVWNSLSLEIKNQVKELYRKHGMTVCHNYGLHIAGSEQQVSILDRDRMMMLVIELQSHEINRWHVIDRDARQILEKHDLAGQKGVCVRYYKSWTGPPHRRGVARRVNGPERQGQAHVQPDQTPAPAQAQVLRALDGPEATMSFWGPYTPGRSYPTIEYTDLFSLTGPPPGPGTDGRMGDHYQNAPTWSRDPPPPYTPPPGTAGSAYRRPRPGDDIMARYGLQNTERAEHVENASISSGYDEDWDGIELGRPIAERPVAAWETR